MTSPWPTVPLAAVAGKTGFITDGDWVVSENMDPNGDIRLLQLADIGIGTFLDRSSKYINESKFQELKCTALQAGDVLISRMADPIGRACIVPELPCRAITAVDVSIVRTDPDVADPRYVVFLCNSPRFLNEAKAGATGTTRSRITRRNLEKILVPLPPVSEQYCIVEILQQADKLRRLRAEADAKANRILPALFIKMFGVPSIWDSHEASRPLGSLVDLKSGATPSKKKSKYWSGKVPWVSPKDMKVDFIEDSQDHVSDVAVKETNLKLVGPGSVLLVVRGMILAHSVPVALNLAAVTINQDMKALVPKTDDITGKYLWAALRVAKPLLRSLVRTAAHGTRKLDTPDLLQLKVPVPEPEQLAACESAVDVHHRVGDRGVASGKKLENLFTVLLHRAFSGELTAGWRESHRNELLLEIEQQAKALGGAVQ